MIEIVCSGGLPGADPFTCATYGENGSGRIGREPGETPSAFKQRARAAAKAAGSGWVTFGGLPQCSS
ncbi:hypothetical+protein [Methylocapsa aurea]